MMMVMMLHLYFEFYFSDYQVLESEIQMRAADLRLGFDNQEKEKRKRQTQKSLLENPNLSICFQSLDHISHKKLESKVFYNYWTELYSRSW